MGNRRWYVNRQGQTLTVIQGPVQFWMGSPETEAERERGQAQDIEQQHFRRIGRSFAIATTSVTVEQFRRFRRFRRDQYYNQQYSPGPDHPINVVTWYDAAAYCNWLSEREGIDESQWCYLPNEKFQNGMRLPDDYLQRTGYRLPTEAEWEYACRAGATTARYYGETETLLGRYAWYSQNSRNRATLPVGSLKPNDLGLFDMLGNVQDWCQEACRFFPEGSERKAVEDREQTDSVSDNEVRVLRGGSFVSLSFGVRAANRDRYLPHNHNNVVGFRPARTYG